MLFSTLAAMTAGYALGVLLGTPIVLRADRYINMLCALLAPKISAKYQDSEEGQRAAGTAYVISVMLAAVLPLLIVLILLYIFVPVLAIIADALVCWSLTDIRGIGRISSAVCRASKTGAVSRGAKNAAALSGEDMTDADTETIIRASVQGNADRTVDTVGTLLAMFVLSGPGGVFFRACAPAAQAAVRQAELAGRRSFAYPAQKLRDVMYFLPGKLAAVIMLVDALFLKFNTRSAEKTMRRDSTKCFLRYYGGCRAVVAGIAGISLLPEEIVGENMTRTYTIGEHIKEPEPQDIIMANQLLSGTAFIVMLLCFAIKLTLGVWF